MSRFPLSERAVLKLQAGYFLVTGLWPLIHYRSFEWISGPKKDDWLVKTLSVFILAAAAALIAGLSRGTAPSDETRTLALGSAAALGGASAWYVLRGRIRPTYLADAATEAALIAALLSARREE